MNIKENTRQVKNNVSDRQVKFRAQNAGRSQAGKN